MGPNGSGKSTLAYVLAGRADYEVTKGDILWNGESLLEMEPEERAAAGVFLAFQYPIEIPGVASLTFLRTALNAVRKARGDKELTTPDFMKLVKEKAAKLSIDMEMLKRPVNVGFSGGEKKRSEILQMEILQPTLCVLDETDSGLDIDALRIVADGVNAMRAKDRVDAGHHPLPAAVELHRARQGARDGGRQDREVRAMPRSRKSSRSPDTPNIRGKPREHGSEIASQGEPAGIGRGGAAGRRPCARHHRKDQSGAGA